VKPVFHDEDFLLKLWRRGLYVMKKRYEILEHIADGKFRAFGRSLEEALGNAALAMVSLMWDSKKIRPAQREKIKVKASSVEQLIVKFLTEFIYLMEVKSFLLGRIDVLKIKKTSRGKRIVYELQAEVSGDRISPGYELYGQVKAVTYNDMKIEKVDNGLVLQVVVDM
jgi:SHS2 domain-containing protein